MHPPKPVENIIFEVRHVEARDYWIRLLWFVGSAAAAGFGFLIISLMISWERAAAASFFIVWGILLFLFLFPLLSLLVKPAKPKVRHW